MIVAFNDLMARLEENLQAQQRFIADAAHQMKTPLTGLKMQAELALRGDRSGADAPVRCSRSPRAPTAPRT